MGFVLGGRVLIGGVMDVGVWDGVLGVAGVLIWNVCELGCVAMI